MTDDERMNSFFETISYVGDVQDWRSMPELGEDDDEDVDDSVFETLGGTGSGNFHHGGRPGTVGGSSGGEATDPFADFFKPSFPPNDPKDEPYALYKGQQIAGDGSSYAMYDIINGPMHGNTVSETTIKKLGLPTEKKQRGAGGAGSGNFGHEGRPGAIGGSGKREKGRRAGAGTLDKIWELHRKGVPVARIQKELGFRHAPHVHQMIKKLKAEREGAAIDVRKVRDVPIVEIKAAAPKAVPPEIKAAPIGALIVPKGGASDLTDPTLVTTTSKRQLGGGGINETFRIKDVDGKEFAFKPMKGERWDGVRDTVVNRAASLAEREVLSSRIDRAIGLNVAPKTVMIRLADGSVGSAQEWVTDGQVPHNFSNFDKTQIAKIGILDAVIGNTDRHPANLLQEPNGRVRAIDHGYVFPTTVQNVELRSWALGKIRNGDISPDDMTTYAGTLKKLDWGEVLRGSHLDQKELAAMQLRVGLVVAHLEKGDLHGLRAAFKPKIDGIKRRW
jgi:hypothetical protein